MKKKTVWSLLLALAMTVTAIGASTAAFAAAPNQAEPQTLIATENEDAIWDQIEALEEKSDAVFQRNEALWDKVDEACNALPDDYDFENFDEAAFIRSMTTLTEAEKETLLNDIKELNELDAQMEKLYGQLPACDNMPLYEKALEKADPKVLDEIDTLEQEYDALLNGIYGEDVDIMQVPDEDLRRYALLSTVRDEVETTNNYPEYLRGLCAETEAKLRLGLFSADPFAERTLEKGLAAYELVPTKNSRSRTLVASPTVVARLHHRKVEQTQQRLMAGCAWEDSNLVFTDALGHHLTKPTVYRHYKKAVAAIGRPDARYHDLRHSYAVAAISSGIDIKTVQGNLGHATAAFTLDVYGHVTDRMKREGADKMEDFIRRVSGD